MGPSLSISRRTSITAGALVTGPACSTWPPSAAEDGRVAGLRGPARGGGMSSRRGDVRGETGRGQPPTSSCPRVSRPRTARRTDDCWPGVGASCRSSAAYEPLLPATSPAPTPAAAHTSSSAASPPVTSLHFTAGITITADMQTAIGKSRISDSPADYRHRTPLLPAAAPRCERDLLCRPMWPGVAGFLANGPNRTVQQAQRGPMPTADGSRPSSPRPTGRDLVCCLHVGHLAPARRSGSRSRQRTVITP
jgi:hypothetical protein